MSWRMITWLNVFFGVAVSMPVNLVFHTRWGLLAFIPWACAMVCWIRSEL